MILLFGKYLNLINTGKYILHFKPIHYRHRGIGPNPIHDSSQFKQEWNQHESARK